MIFDVETVAYVDVRGFDVLLVAGADFSSRS